MSRKEFSGVSDQRKAAFKRLRDAQSLLGRRAGADWMNTKGHHALGAMYLAGYAIECKVKAIAMEVHQCRTLAALVKRLGVDDRDVYTHGLEVLLRHLPSYARFQRSAVWRHFVGQVSRWRPSWRYDPADHPNAEAAAFVESVLHVYNWLENNG